MEDNSTLHISKLIKRLSDTFNADDITAALELDDWKVPSSFSTSNPNLLSSNEFVTADEKDLLHKFIYGYLVHKSPEHGLSSLIDVFGKESIFEVCQQNPARNSNQVNPRIVLEDFGLYAPREHQRCFAPEELIKRSLQKLDEFRQLQPYLNIPEIAVLNSPDTYRGHSVGLFTLFDALLTLMIVFYRSQFSRDDDYLDAVFNYVLEARSSGTGKMLSRLHEIHELFTDGLSNRQKNTLQKDTKKTISDYERARDQRIANLNEQYRDAQKKRDRIIEERQEKQVRYDTMANRATVYDGKNLSGEDNPLGKELDELIKQLDVISGDILLIESKIKQEKENFSSKKKACNNEESQLLNKRKEVAELLQKQCQRQLSRPTPFYGLDIEGLKEFNRRYRNDAAHELEEKIIVDSFEKYEQLVQELIDWIKYLTDRRFCPKTARILGNWKDIYERDVLVICPGTLDIPHKIWLPNELYWTYFWLSLPFSQDEECFIVSEQGVPVFEPMIESCRTINQHMEEFGVSLNVNLP